MQIFELNKNEFCNFESKVKKMEEYKYKPGNDHNNDYDNCIKDHPDCLYNWIIIGVICFLFIVVPSIGFMYCACREKCCPGEASVDGSGGFSKTGQSALSANQIKESLIQSEGSF